MSKGADVIKFNKAGSDLETARFPASAVSTKRRETSRHIYAQCWTFFSNACKKLRIQHQKPVLKFWCELLLIFFRIIPERIIYIGRCKIMWSIKGEERFLSKASLVWYQLTGRRRKNDSETVVYQTTAEVFFTPWKIKWQHFRERKKKTARGFYFNFNCLFWNLRL